MSDRNYAACLHDVSVPEVDQGPPPTSILNELIDAIDPLPDAVFTENQYDDIYTKMVDSLGPWQSLLHRKAVMCEVLRVLGGFESSWNWDEGVDTDNQESESDIWGQETGVFQVSANSVEFYDYDGSLEQCLKDHGAWGGGEKLDPQTFIDNMKSNHQLAVEYCARLLRFNTNWDGPIKEGWVAAAAWAPAVTEFMGFLSP